MPVSQDPHPLSEVSTVPTDPKIIGKYTYSVTPADLEREQQAFEAGEGVCI